MVLISESHIVWLSLVVHLVYNCTYVHPCYTWSPCPPVCRPYSLELANSCNVISCGPSQDEKLVVTYLRCTIVDMALYFAPLDSLKATFKELRRERRYHNLLLGLLQDLVTHSSFQVRRYIAILFGVCTTPSLWLWLCTVERNSRQQAGGYEGCVQPSLLPMKGGLPRCKLACRMSFLAHYSWFSKSGIQQ